MTEQDDWQPPPVDRCLWCEERIEPRDRLSPDPVMTSAGKRYTHWECGLRMVIGGLNHLNGRCSCCGGDLPPDPPGETKRWAARMAAQAWMTRQLERPQE